MEQSPFQTGHLEIKPVGCEGKCVTCFSICIGGITYYCKALQACAEIITEP